MSYILDALVKADQERQRQGVPDLHTVPAGLPVAVGFQRRWPTTAAGALLALALLALVWGRLGPGPAPVTTPDPVREVPMVARQAAPPPAAIARQAPTTSVAPAPRPAPPAREAAPSGGTEKTAEERAARPGSRLYAIAELPPALQEQARNIKVAGFAQASDNEERMAIINDRAWREGDQVTTGLRVERISSDGVIFNLKGYRFRKGAA